MLQELFHISKGEHRRIADGGMILLTEGTSWPGGLEQKRFGWLQLPESEAAIVENLLYALDADLGERDAVLAWGDDASSSPNCNPGLIAFVIAAPKRNMSLIAVEKLARKISSIRHEFAAIRIEQNSVVDAARTISKMARSREPLFDMI